MENLKTNLLMLLRGLGQIMLQGNAATGLLFVLGIAIHSVRLACAAIVGAAIGTVWAKICKYPTLSGFRTAALW